MEILENNITCSCMNDDMVIPYPPMHGMPMPCPMPMPYAPANDMPMPIPYPPMNGMPNPCPMPCPPINDMPIMPYPPMNGMPMPCPMPPMPGPMPPPMPCPPMPGPMPPMPIEECNEETLRHLEKMYCMHMYMAAMNKSEAYRHKMMHCHCKHQMEED